MTGEASLTGEAGAHVGDGAVVYGFATGPFGSCTATFSLYHLHQPSLDCHLPRIKSMRLRERLPLGQSRRRFVEPRPWTGVVNLISSTSSPTHVKLVHGGIVRPYQLAVIPCRFRQNNGHDVNA